MPFFMTRNLSWRGCPFLPRRRMPPIFKADRKRGLIREGPLALQAFGRAQAAIVPLAWRARPYIQPGINKKAGRLARGDSDFAKETARVAAGRPKSRSLAPLRGVLPFLRPYRGRITVACLALVASSSATLVQPLFLRGLVNAQGLTAAQAHALTGFYAAFI